MGADVQVTTATSSAGPRVFAAADESSVTLFNLSNRTLPTTVKGSLIKMAERFPRAIASPDGLRLKDGALVLASDGVFLDDVKIAELREIVEVIDRADVREITVSRRAHGSTLGAAIGAGAGFAGGFLLAAGLAQGGCACDDTTVLMGASLVGFPLLGGILGYHVKHNDEPRVIVYRR
jgi:hypothetical protein